MSALSPRSIGALAVLIASALACAHRGHAASERPPAPEKAAPNVVSSETINESAGQPIEKILANRVSGVTLSHAPDGSLTVQIRGASSINANTQPLFVIDGIAITPGPGGSLSGINPHDIASIEVLKDAASTTMYGSRGANGVIFIKMKKPE